MGQLRTSTRPGRPVGRAVAACILLVGLAACGPGADGQDALGGFGLPTQGGYCDAGGRGVVVLDTVALG